MEDYKPVIPFFADSFINAFVLNGLVMSAVTVISLSIRDKQRGDHASFWDYMTVFLATFISALAVYAIFFILDKITELLLSFK